MQTVQGQTRDRLVSLDVFRGMTVAGMIVVNTPGSVDFVYPPLTHATWNGWTCADVIFPFFLFIMGVAITLSLPGPEALHVHQRSIVTRALRRSVLLFALGVFLENFPQYHLATLRIPGVLQRIALCYLVVVIIFVQSHFRGQAVITVAILALYWALMLLAPVPSGGTGLLEPQHNLAAYIDNLLLPGHLAHGTWDSEGVLSTLPAVTSTLLGALTGHWLTIPGRSHGQKTIGLVLMGITAVTVGQIMNHWFPINKNLWTSSYVVLTWGIALLVFAGCYWLVDGRGYQRLLTPFLIFGMNPLLVYILATLGAHLLDFISVTDVDGTPLALRAALYEHYFASWAGPTLGSFLFALTYACVWFGPMALLYQRRIFVRL
jgi:predicted acyltransferase